MLTRSSANQPLRYNGTPYRNEDTSTVVSFTFEANKKGGYTFYSKCITTIDGKYQQVTKARTLPFSYPEYIMITLVGAVSEILREAHGVDAYSNIYKEIANYFDANEQKLADLLEIVNKL